MTPAMEVVLILYLPLFILSLVFLIKAIRRKNKIQAFIFFIAFGFCVYRLLIAILFELIP